MLTVEQAVAEVLAAVRPLGAETVLLDDALDRVVAEDVIAERRLPPWDNSAMDGFALRAAEYPLNLAFPVAFTVGAGDAPRELPAGFAARIMTGAPMPAGADTVVMREDAVEISRDMVEFTRPPRVGDHVRRAGEDVAPGDRVLVAGAVVRPGEIGLLAAIGRTLVAVHRRPRVAIVSTGSELVEADRVPGAGRIVGSNGRALAAQVRAAGAVATVLPLVRDDRDAIAAAFADALAAADVVLSSGGVSVGDFDYVKPALDSLGVEQRFWRVAMKPGKPVTFAISPTGKPVFGLPGNPASSMVGFELFVRPALGRLAGRAAGLERPRAVARLDEPYAHDGGRRHFLRGVVRRDGAGLRARRIAAQGSGMLRSMVGVNALIDIPGDARELAVGAEVQVVLLDAV